MSEEVLIEHVDPAATFALLESGDVCEITNIYDEFGDEIDWDDTETEPVSAVFQLPDERWATLWLERIPHHTIH